MKRRILSLLAALALLVTVLPVNAAAAGSIDLIAYSSQDGSAIMLWWNDSGTGTYTIQRKKAGDSTYTTLKTGVKGCEYRNTVDKTLKTVYLYRVKNESTVVYSDWMPAKAMVGVSDLKATRSGSTVTLSWTAGRYCDGYIVEDMYGDFASDDVKDNQSITTGTSYTFKDVAMGVQHVYFVVPYTSTSYGVCSGNDENGVDMVRLGTPTLTVSKTDGKVKLSWGAVKGATKYYIYRGTGSDNLSYYDTTTKTGYTNSSVTSGTRYYYQVKAASNFYEKTFTGSKSTVKSTIPLTTPSLTAKLSNGAVKLSWGAVKGAAKYYIYRGTSSDSLKYYDTTTKTDYTNSSVTGGTTYYYKVKAVKTVSGTDWTSDYSAVKSVKVLKTPALTLSTSGSKVKLSWETVSGAAKYYIYRGTTSGDLKYYDSTTSTSYTNSSVTGGTWYYYQVKAVNSAGGTGKLSAVKSTVPLTAPVVTATVTGSGSAKLSWGAVTGAAKYAIYRSTDGQTFSRYDSTTKTSYTNMSVTAGKTYYYKVKAIKTVGSTDYTSSDSTVVKVTIPR